MAREFLDSDLRARLVNEIREATSRPATVRDRGANAVDETVRKTKIAQLDEATVLLIEERIQSLKPVLESYFAVRTTGCRRPDFLVYREGDFFAPHADNVPDADAPDDIITGRRVSVVIFLNGESDTPAPDTYGGGSLTFFGLWDDPAMQKYGFPLTGEPGLLLAFRPDVVHSVAPVTHGERYTIVAWLDG